MTPAAVVGGNGQSSLRYRRRDEPRPLHLMMTMGATREPLDPVRFLSNYSTGFMGACLSEEALRRGHRVTVISGPTVYAPPAEAEVVRVETAAQMQQALSQRFPEADVLIMAAAVSDFQPATPRSFKRPRTGMLRLTLKATPDIVAGLPRRRGQRLVGFALETDQALTRAQRKLKRKRLDLIVGQEFSATGGTPVVGPFGKRPVNAFLVHASGRVKQLGVVSKPHLARAILDEVERLWYGGVRRRRQARALVGVGLAGPFGHAPR